MSFIVFEVDTTPCFEQIPQAPVLVPLLGKRHATPRPRDSNPTSTTILATFVHENCHCLVLGGSFSHYVGDNH
jgi:hypothetical protein